MQIWKRLDGEPAVWFARFDAFRMIGPMRSIDEAYRRVSGLHRLSGKRPGQAWYNAADTWRWWERAEAWDEAERSRLMAMEQRRRFDAREERLRTIAQMMGMVQGVIATAEPESLSVAEARDLLPMMRLMLRDMLAAQRLEMGLPQMDGDGSDEVLPFSADELARARRELAEAGHGGSVPMMAGMAGVAASNSFTSALVDALARLYPEEQSARRVAAVAGVDVTGVRFGSARNTWHEIVVEAQYMGQVDDLLAVVGGEYGASGEWIEVVGKGGIDAG